jgi:hypothetical protein
MLRNGLLILCLSLIACATTYDLNPTFGPAINPPDAPYGSLTMINVIDARPQTEVLGRPAGTIPGKPDFGIEIIGDKSFQASAPKSIDKTIKEQMVAKKMFNPIVQSIGAPFVLEAVLNHFNMTLDRSAILQPGMTETRKDKALAKLNIQMEVQVLFAKHQGDTLVKETITIQKSMEDTYAHLRRSNPASTLAQDVIKDFVNQLADKMNNALNPPPVILEPEPVPPPVVTEEAPVAPVDTTAQTEQEIIPPEETPIPEPTAEPDTTQKPEPRPKPEPGPEPEPKPTE